MIPEIVIVINGVVLTLIIIDRFRDRRRRRHIEDRLDGHDMHLESIEAGQDLLERRHVSLRQRVNATDCRQMSETVPRRASTSAQLQHLAAGNDLSVRNFQFSQANVAHH